MAKMHDSYEDQIWDFFSKYVIPSATKYQITYDDIPDVNDKQKFEDTCILLKAVFGETKSSVSCMCIYIYCSIKHVIFR